MALKLVNPGVQPLGHFDLKDDVNLTELKGGEVAVFVSASVSDSGASDAKDGYLPDPSALRVAVTTNLRASTTATSAEKARRPFMLTDDGVAGYGTLFGTIVGGTVGQQVTGGAVLGPHSTSGSGKVTLWDKPGLYAVTLDAVDSVNLKPSNGGLTAGSPLFATEKGKLTSLSSAGFDYSTTSTVVGNLVSFETDRTLVTTPNRLVAALNSPSGSPSPLASASKFTVAVFHFDPHSTRTA